VLANTVLLHLKRGVITAVPVNNKIERLVRDAHDDLVDQGSDDALARCRGPPAPGLFQARSRSQPSANSLCRSCSLSEGIRHRSQRVTLVLECSCRQEAFVPAPLQFAGDKPIIWIDGVILPTGTSCLVTRLLQRQLDLAPLLLVLAPVRLHGRERGFYAERLHPGDDLHADRMIDAHAAKRDTGAAAVVHLAAAAVISTGTAVYAAVGDVKLATAMAAAEQSCKQRLAASDRTFAHEALPVGVVGDQSLIPLERAPGNVTLMVIVDQNLPSLRLRRKPRTIFLRPASMVTRLAVRPKA